MYGKSLQLCLILCDPMDYSLSGSSVHVVLQARILEWVAIPFSRESSRLNTSPATPALQADPLSLSHQGKPEWLILVAISDYTDVTNCINFPRFYNNTVYSVTVLVAEVQNQELARLYFL